MSTTLCFQSVWDRTLTSLQKDKLRKLSQTLPTVNNRLSVSPVVVKRKKNGGIVATVFLQNGYAHPYNVDDTTVQIVSEKGVVIAVNNFKPSLTIPAKSTMPWSFIFPAEVVINPDGIQQDLSVILV